MIQTGRFGKHPKKSFRSTSSLIQFMESRASMLNAFIRPLGQYIPWFGGFQSCFAFEMTAMQMWRTAATGCYAQLFIMAIRCLTKVPITGHLSDRSASKPARESIPALQPHQFERQLWATRQTPLRPCRHNSYVCRICCCDSVSVSRIKKTASLYTTSTPFSVRQKRAPSRKQGQSDGPCGMP